MEKALEDARNLMGIIRAGCDSEYADLAISVTERIIRNLSSGDIEKKEEK